ncbi:Survival protein SurA precursor protein [Caenispirillum salinarum AK4]|uniref:Parvulin-like PPIase n=1 Tax=Caenispirillum salinarum AK4 TaxID=1238182 RepID=K9GY57_9PROT|nr:peptidylprolyl isomerase [Caenispirillum salinarum]EKV30177.1 Survival protein SurA precursor protein [Caenispirillum salinarum AK4]
MSIHTASPRSAAPAPRHRARRIAAAGLAAALLLSATPLAPGALPLSASPAAAQDIQRIAAVVNQDAVSLRDIITRMDFIIATSNLPDSQETRQRLLPQVLQGLIGEALRMQEAERLGIEVSESDMAEGIRQVEAQNNLAPGALRQQMTQAGIPFGTFERQVRAEIAWIKVVQSSLAGRVTVSEAEVDARLEQLKEAQGKPEALLAQIYLPVEDPTREAEVRQAAERLAQQIASGANFRALAQQFSRDPSAARGGDMGWIPLPTLEPELRQAIAETPENRITPPIRTAAGYTILLVRGKRVAGAQAPARQGLELAQIMLPDTGANAMPEERRAALTERAQATRSCEEFVALAEDIGTPGSGRVGSVTLGDLPEAVAAAVSNLPEEQASRSVPVAGGEVVAMICDRGGSGGLPDREAVRQQIKQEKVESLSQRRLRDLRRAAIVDVRL